MDSILNLRHIGALICIGLSMFSCSSGDSSSSGTSPSTPVSEPTVYIGGSISYLGGTVADDLAVFSEGKWSAIGGFNEASSSTLVRSLTWDADNKLLVAGKLPTSTGLSPNTIGRWESDWTSLGAPDMLIVTTVATDKNGFVYAGGGDSDTVGTVSKYDGTGWTNIGTCKGYVYAIVFDAENNMYIACAGNTATSSPGYVRKWDGTNWSDLGSGMDSGVVTLTIDSYGTLFAGGGFKTANGASVSGIAKWTGNTWEAVGSGLNGVVYSLAINSQGVMHAAGDKLTGGNVVYLSGVKWSGLPTTPNGAVLKISFDSSDRMYAGGSFSGIGAVATNGLARWDGASWSNLNNDLVAGSVVQTILIK